MFQLNSPADSPNRIRFRSFMRILGLLYFLFAGVVFFLPSPLISVIDAFSKIAPGLLPFPESGPTGPAFWSVMASALLITLAGISWISSVSPRNNALIFLHLFSKIATFLGFLRLYLIGTHYFAYALAMAIDGLIALIILVLWIGMSISSSKAPAPAPGISNEEL